MELDAKAGVRNLDLTGYTGFAFSAPEDKVPGGVSSVMAGGVVREIATMRVDHYNFAGGELGDHKVMDRRNWLAAQIESRKSATGRREEIHIQM
jgi:hypothetical protein